MSLEEWRQIAGYEGRYEVSSAGRVRSHLERHGRRAGEPLALMGSPTGHLRVGLSLDGRTSVRLVHQLVAEAFIGPRPHRYETRHLDGDPTNNHLSNLAYGTQSENQLDSVRLGVHPQTRKTHCPSGHPYSGSNLKVKVRSNGKSSRICRTCERVSKRVNNRRYRARKRAQR